LSVNLLQQKGKLKRCRTARHSFAMTRKPRVRKAFVTLRGGDKIEVL
jgi:ribosomal protein L23